MGWGAQSCRMNTLRYDFGEAMAEISVLRRCRSVQGILLKE